jgi:hypothetical protein
MQDVLPISLILLIAMIFTARMILLLSDTPVASCRLWPWLRLQVWWPVPADHAAETLLRTALTTEEYRQLCSMAFLDVPSPSRSGRVYRVPRGPGQVQVIEHGRMVERLCVQPVATVPEADVVLMHKLLIESDEQGYLDTANHFPRSVWR